MPSGWGLLFQLRASAPAPNRRMVRRPRQASPKLSTQGLRALRESHVSTCVRFATYGIVLNRVRSVATVVKVIEASAQR